MPLGTCFHADILRSSSLSPGTYHSCPVDEWDKTVTSVFASDSDARHDLLQSAEVLAVLAIHLIDMPHCVYYVAMSQRCSDMFLGVPTLLSWFQPGLAKPPFSCKVGQS